MLRFFCVAVAVCVATPVSAYDSLCGIRGEKCVEGPPVAFGRWFGELADDHSSEHHDILIEAVRRSRVPERVLHASRYRVYTADADYTFVSNQACMLPLPPEDEDEGLFDALVGWVEAQIGAAIDFAEDPSGVIWDGVMSKAYQAALAEPCGSGRCVRDASAVADGLPSQVGYCTVEQPRGMPVAFARAQTVFEQHRNAAEMTQLPDFAHTFWDFLSGLETCPFGADIPLADCHEFSKHMGAYNSSHFVPQAQNFFRYYHRLAKARAAHCKDVLEARLGDDVRHAPLIQACREEAMALEGIAQHYLQDSFSIGHMWERWGSPNPEDFPVAGGGYALAHVAAMFSGLIHGAKGVTGVDDALCAPHEHVRFRAPWANGTHLGVGDYFLDDVLSDDTYSVQRRQLLACAAAAVEEVYDAMGTPYGDDEVAAPLPTVDPTSDDCFGQRVTNRAIVQGAGVTLVEGVTPVDGVTIGRVHIGFDELSTAALVIGLSQQKRGVVGDLSVGQMLGIRESINEFIMTALISSDGTNVAEGDMPALGGERDWLTGRRVGGVLPNGAYVYDPPASYSDVYPSAASELVALSANDLTVDLQKRSPVISDVERSSVLAHALHRSHAALWCERFAAGDPDGYDIEALKARVDATKRDLDTADQGNRDVRYERWNVACEVCVEFASRHVRVGTSDAYDRSAEPACALLTDDPQIVYVDASCGYDLESFTGVTAAHRYCECPSVAPNGFVAGVGRGGASSSGGMAASWPNGGDGGISDPGGSGGPGGPGHALCSLGGCLHGDPHLTTHDGLAYDFQGHGEFVLMRTTDDVDAIVEVQGRFEPLGDARCGGVTVATAVALRIGGHDFMLDAHDNVLYRDGLPYVLDGFAQLGDCSTLYRSHNRYVFSYPGGITIFAEHRDGVLTLDTKVDSHDLPVKGLWGTNDGEVDNDFTRPDGSVIAQPLDHAAMYRDFGAAWRVTSTSSLFHYRAGESTATFTDEDFPTVADTVADLEPEARAAAEALCAQHELDPVRLAECALDVACGGEDFLAAYANIAPPTAVHGEPSSDTCSMTASGFFVLEAGDDPDEVFSLSCPAGCGWGSFQNVWGTDIYTDDSSICGAAIHVGVITDEVGGEVGFAWRPGQASYVGSERNGFVTLDWGEWGHSFVIVP